MSGFVAFTTGQPLICWCTFSKKAVPDWISLSRSSLKSLLR